MFGLSFVEVIAIGVILLIVVGPKQLPEVARTIARFLNEFKRTTSEFTDSFYNIRTDVAKSMDQAREKLSQQVGLDQLNKELEDVKNSATQEPRAAPAESDTSSEGERKESLRKPDGGSTP